MPRKRTTWIPVLVVARTRVPGCFKLRDVPHRLPLRNLLAATERRSSIIPQTTVPTLAAPAITAPAHVLKVSAVRVGL